MVEVSLNEKEVGVLKENNILIGKNCVQLLSSIQDILDYNALAKNEFILHQEEFNVIFVI
jgi:hypothetical protein